LQRGTRDAPTAELLRHEQREPAELARVAGDGRVVGDGLVGEAAHHRHRAPRLDEAGRRLPEQLLVVGQLEIHLAPLTATVLNLSAGAFALAAHICLQLYNAYV